jgi:uncharacterized protein (TIGR02391 family)
MTLRPRAKISTAQIPAAIRKLTRRIDELEEIERIEDAGGDFYGAAKIIANKVNATIDDIFGTESAEAIDFRIKYQWFTSQWETDFEKLWARFLVGRDHTMAVLKSAIQRLEEQLSDAGQDDRDSVLRAYEGLDLHPEIARAASDLYRNGHHANAIEDAVKALNNLVRLRSGLDLDGAKLMETAFGSKNPKLRFNDLSDQTDQDEQKGFMMMFSGAVAGLRNPRAHRLIQDDPERALEFIAYVSLLAKLLDEAK